MTTTQPTNQVKFVLLEASTEDGSPLENIFSAYDEQVIYFEDPDNFDPSSVIMFETYNQAVSIQRMIQDFKNVRLGIAIWESEFPNCVDKSYWNYGEKKNMQVKKNRESGVWTEA